MDVYLIPTGNGEYELYCESGDDPETVGVAPTGLRGKLLVQFQTVVAAAEQARRRHAQGDTRREAGAWSRLKARGLRWIAEKIAEQRLLWRLQRRNEATAIYPDDIPEAQAGALLLAMLRRDGDRHRRWLVIDALLFIASGVLMVVPGPNLVAYYFAFRLVGHYLSMRGARQGSRAVTWQMLPSAPLTDLRQALSLAGEDRNAALDRVAAALGLDHLATFVRRTASVAG